MEGMARARGRRESAFGVLPGPFRRRRAGHPQAVAGVRRPLQGAQARAGPGIGSRDLSAAAKGQGHRRLRGGPRSADGRAEPREGARGARGRRAHASAAGRSGERRRSLRPSPRRAHPSGRARRNTSGMPQRARGRRAHRLRHSDPEDPDGRRAHVLERSAAPAADPTGSLQVLPGGGGLHRRRAPYVRADGETPLRGRAGGGDPREREAPERDALRRPRLCRDRIRAEVRVHQFHPTLAPGDAMSNHVFALRKKFRHWGYDSFAYAVEAKPGVADVRSYRRLFREVNPDDLLIVHFSMGSEVVDQLVKIPARRVLVYHNITPPEFFSGINPHAAAFSRLGLRQLSRIAPAFELGIGVSEFNRRALAEAGYEETTRVPILLDWEHFAVPPNDAVLARWKGLRTMLLFVGRISPNKRQDDLVRMLAYYRRCIDPGAHLVLVGPYRDQPQYHGRGVALTETLRPGGAAEFAGGVGDPAALPYC